MKKITTSLLFAFALLSIQAQTTIATWSFPASTTSITTTSAIPAVCGTLSGSANMYLNGTNGSTTWVNPIAAVVNTGFTGTGATQCLYAGGNGTPVSAINLASTGAGVTPSAVFVLSTTGYNNLKLNYTVRPFAGSFTTLTWSHSTDGTNFTSITPSTTIATGVPTSIQTVDFSGVSALQGATTIYIKLTLSGSTGSGACRFDFFNFTGASTSGADPSLAFAATTISKASNDAQFTITPTSLNTTTPITYSSNATSIADVDATGKVTIKTTGIAIITANQAAGVSNGTTYAAATPASYTLYIGSPAKNYSLVSSAADLVPNKNYLLVTKTTGAGATYYAMGNQDASNKRSGRVVTETAGNISAIQGAVSNDTSNPFEFSLTQNATNWNILDKLNNQYLKPLGTSLGLQVQPTAVDWTISINEANGTATTSATDNVTYTFNNLAFNSGAATLAFNCYDAASVSGKQPIYLYREGMVAPAATAATGKSTSGFTANWTVAPTATSYELTVAQGTPGGTLTPIAGSPFTISDGVTNTYVLTGLADNTAYCYKVRANDGSNWSTYSNFTAVTTGNPTAVSAAKTYPVYAKNGSIFVNTEAGMDITVYNNIGQQISKTKSISGINKVAVNAKGVVLVKVGTQVTKVVL